MNMNLKEAKEVLEFEFVENDLKQISPKDRLNFYLALMEYFSPKLNRVGYETEDLLREIIITDATKGDKGFSGLD